MDWYSSPTTKRSPPVPSERRSSSSVCRRFVSWNSSTMIDRKRSRVRARSSAWSRRRSRARSWRSSKSSGRVPLLRLCVRVREVAQELLEQLSIARRELLERRRHDRVAGLDERRRPRPARLQVGQREEPLRQGRDSEQVEGRLGRPALELGRPEVVDEARRRLAKLLRTLVEPGARRRLEHERTSRRAERRVHADEHLPEPGRTVRREQAPAVGLVCRAEPLERGRERLGLHDHRLGLVQDAEGRVDPRRERMRAEQPPAEAVDRRDPGAVELERELGPTQLEQPSADPCPQLARGALRVGDHEQRLHVEPLVDHRAHEPLHEHGRLAGARPRRDEDVPAGLDRGALLGVGSGSHGRAFRQIRHRSHQCGQSPPCGSWRTSPARMRSTSPTAVPRAPSTASSNSAGSR